MPLGNLQLMLFCLFLLYPAVASDPAYVDAAVYSARNEGKAHCFDLIEERFGEDCNFIAIGMVLHEAYCVQFLLLLSKLVLLAALSCCGCMGYPVGR